MSLEDILMMKEKPREKVVLIDTNNLSMRSLFIAGVIGKTYDTSTLNYKDLSDWETKGFIPSAYKNTVLMSINKICKEFQPNKIIFCREGKNNWRKNYYPEYKANRAKIREESAVNFDIFYKESDEFFSGLSKTLENALFLAVEHLEADDLIACITKHRTDWDIIAVTTDHDFYQLHKYANFKQYDPIKEQFINVISPENALLEKIVRGDKGDNIPSLKRGVGEKTFQKILSEGLDEWISINGFREAFERNTKLISFECIPLEYTKNVDNIIDNWEQGTFNGREFYNFIVKNGLGNIVERSDEFINTFSAIKSI